MHMSKIALKGNQIRKKICCCFTLSLGEKKKVGLKWFLLMFWLKGSKQDIFQITFQTEQCRHPP